MAQGRREAGGHIGTDRLAAEAFPVPQFPKRLGTGIPLQQGRVWSFFLCRLTPQPPANSISPPHPEEHPCGMVGMLLTPSLGQPGSDWGRFLRYSPPHTRPGAGGDGDGRQGRSAGDAGRMREDAGEECGGCRRCSRVGGRKGQDAKGGGRCGAARERDWRTHRREFGGVDEMWRDAKEIWEEEGGTWWGVQRRGHTVGAAGKLSLGLGPQPLCHRLPASELSGGGGCPQSPSPTMATAPNPGSASRRRGGAPPARPQPRSRPGAAVPTCGSPRARAAGEARREQHPCGATGSCSGRHGYGLPRPAPAGLTPPPPPPSSPPPFTPPQPHTDTQTSSTDGPTAAASARVGAHRHAQASPTHEHAHPPRPPRRCGQAHTQARTPLCTHMCPVQHLS